MDTNTYIFFIILAIVCFALAHVLDIKRNSITNQKDNTTMQTVTPASAQELANNFSFVATLESLGLYELYATSLAISPQSKGSNVLYGALSQPLVTSLRSCAVWAWENLGDNAQTAIVHLGRYMDANIGAFKPVQNKGVWSTPMNYWKKDAPEIVSLFATLGYRMTPAIVTPVQTAKPISATLVSATPKNFDPYPKHIEILGNTYTLGTAGNNGILKDGSCKYVKGNVNPAIVENLEFTTNDAVYMVTGVQFNGRTVNVKFIRMENPTTAKPLPTTRKDKSVKAIAQTNVKPMDNTPTQDPVMAMLQQIANQQNVITKVLQDNGLME